MIYKEAKEVSISFRKELNELLKKYKATMEIEDLPTNNTYTVPDKTIKVYISANYGEDGECVSEFAEINLRGLKIILPNIRFFDFGFLNLGNKQKQTWKQQTKF